MFARLIEHIADSACTHTDKHFNKVGTADGKERNARFAGNSFCHQRFTRSRIAHQQAAFGDPAADKLKTDGVAEILHDFPDFLFGFISSGDIAEFDVEFVRRDHAGFAFAEIHCSLTVAHLAHRDEVDHSDDQQHRQNAHQKKVPQAIVIAADFDGCFAQKIVEFF